MTVNGATTRTARRNFKDTYGDTTYQIVSRICKGWGSRRIADTLDVPVSTVRTTRANFTRGVYDTVIEDCNF